jgi:hypothetical protein
MLARSEFRQEPFNLWRSDERADKVCKTVQAGGDVAKDFDRRRVKRVRQTADNCLHF